MNQRTDSSPLFSAAFSLALSGACFLDALFLAVSPRHDAVYHLVGSVWAVLLPLVFNVLLLAAVFYAAMACVRPFPRAARILYAALLSILPWVLVKNICFLRGHTFPHHQSVALLLGCCVCALTLGALPWNWAHRAFEAAWATGRAFLFIAGGVVAVTLLQILYFGFLARHLNADSSPAESVRVGVTAPAGRVIWIVFDELGYEQVYGHRLTGLALPNFDRLAAESTVFTDARPAGMYTEFVLPSLFTGLHVLSTRASADGRDLTLSTPTGQLPFNMQDTVFADADALGYRSGVVGWYNPYCRLLTSVLSTCYWTGQTELSDLFPAHSFWPNLLHPLIRLMHKAPAFIHHPEGPSLDEMDEGRLHIADFINLDRESRAALRDSSDNFLLLHLPVPHPTGIWDRHTHRFAVDRSSYVDNLALADIYLGRVRSLLEAKGQWDTATVVIMGDHAWRTQLLWVGQPSWNIDDQRASEGGHFDDRPAYIVKLPGQRVPALITQPFAAVNTRPLLDALLAHRIQNPVELARWVNSSSSR